MTIFERATRQKLRFGTVKGGITIEDLWDLQLTGDISLDSLAKSLYKAIKETEDESFVEAPKPNPEEVANRLRFEIVKRIIEVKLIDKNAAEKAVETRAKKQKIMEALAAKKDASLQQMSEEELQKALDDLG